MSILVKSTFHLSCLFMDAHFLPPATKLGQGYVFTRVCDSFHGGSASVHAGIPTTPGKETPPLARQTPMRSVCWEIRSKAGGMLPTGMQFLFLFIISLLVICKYLYFNLLLTHPRFIEFNEINTILRFLNFKN